LKNAGGADQLSSVSAKYLWMATYHNGLIAELDAKFFKEYGLKRKSFEVTAEELPLLQSVGI